MKMNDNGMFTLKLNPGFFRVSTAAKYRITIECDGDTTTAKMIVNGKEVKQAIAKRNPADKANWRIGAQTAFDRLWAKQEKPEKTVGIGGFKVGDWVVVTNPSPSFKYFEGERGRVVAFGCNYSGKFVGVELDNDFALGHECNLYSNDHKPHAKPGHGMWFTASELRHEQPTKQKEVKRNAEVGEYVKLTKPAFSFMKTGDIVRVSSVSIPDGSAMVRECDLARPSGTTVAPNYEWFIFNHYVVLEGYQPGRDA